MKNIENDVEGKEMKRIVRKEYTLNKKEIKEALISFIGNRFSANVPDNCVVGFYKDGEVTIHWEEQEKE